MRVRRCNRAIAISYFALYFVAACGTSGGDDSNRPATTNRTFSSASAVSVAENTTGTALTVAVTQVSGETVQFSLSGNDSGEMTIDASSGAIQFVAAPDFEVPRDAGGNNVYNVSVMASYSAGTSITQNLTFTVTDVNEAPVFSSPASINVAENTLDTGLILVAADPDSGDVVTYTINGGVDQAQFTVDAMNGNILFVAQPDFEVPTDSDQDNSYEADLLATDNGGLTDSLSVQVSVTDVSQIEVSVLYPTAFGNIGGEEGGSVVTGKMIDLEDGIVDPGDAASIIVNGVTATQSPPDRWSALDVPIAATSGLEVVATSESGNEFRIVRDVHNTPHLACLGSFDKDASDTKLYGVDVFLKSLIEIEYPSGASWRIVSDPVRGSGPDWNNPTGIVIEPGDQTAIVADDGGSAIIRVDLATGDRTIVSGLGIGSGPPFQSPSDVAFHPSGASVMVPDFAADTILDVNLTDGSRTVLFDESIGSGVAIVGPGSVNVDGVGNRAIVVSQIMSGVYAIDLATGNREVISDAGRGSGSQIVLPFDLVIDSAGLNAYMSDVFEPSILFRIDLASGDRTNLGPPNFGPLALLLDEPRNWLVVADCRHRQVVAYDPSDGSQLTTLVDSNRGLRLISQVLDGITYDASQDRIILALRNAEGTLAAIHPEQGFLTTLSSSLRGIGTGPQLDSSIRDPVTDPSNNRVLLVSGLGLVAIDLTSGDRTILSDTTTGSGPIFAVPVALAHDPVSDAAFVLDFGGTLYMVDLTTGDRTIITDNSTGSGPGLVSPRDMDIDVAGNRVIVGDSGLNALITVDLTSGARTVLSDASTGAGSNFIVLEGIAMDSVTNKVLVANRMTFQNIVGPEVTEAGIIAVDLDTGDRSILNRGRPFPIGAKDISVDDEGRRVFLLDSLLRELLVIDSATGESSIVDLPSGTVF